MSMFVDHLLEALFIPHRRQTTPGDDLVVDSARYRNLFMSEIRRQAELIERREHLIASVRDGSLDEFLFQVGDALIEMGVVRDQILLDQFLGAAVYLRLGLPVPMTPTDRLLLEEACRQPAAGTEEVDTRLLARRYAIQLGLLIPHGPGEPASCTELGDAVRRLPCELVLPFLVSLEMLSSYGAGDPWRAPREAYERIYERGEILLPPQGPGHEARVRELDPHGLFRIGRLRRFVRMGLCDLLPERHRPAACDYAVQLTGAGQRALREALRDPPGDVAKLCEQLFLFSREQALSQLTPRSSRATVLPLRQGGSDRSRNRRSADLTSVQLHDKGPGGKTEPDPEALPPPPIPQSAAATSGVEIRLDSLADDDLFEPLPNAGLDAPGRATTRPRGSQARVAPRVSPPPPPPQVHGEPVQAGTVQFQTDDGDTIDMEALCKGVLRDLAANPNYAHIGASLNVQPGVGLCRLGPGAGRRALRMLLAEILTMAASSVARLPLPRIQVEIGSTDGEMYLLLHENGPGIPVSQRPRVFADHGSDKEPNPRYILGGVRRIVEETLRGRIEIAAPRLGGASFRLTLPRASQQKAA